MRGKTISNLIAVWKESPGGCGMGADIVSPTVPVDFIATPFESSNSRRSRSVSIRRNLVG